MASTALRKLKPRKSPSSPPVFAVTVKLTDEAEFA
jgi:hypothetical protein